MLILILPVSRRYVVRDVAEDFPFAPRVRKEVSRVAFFPFDALPRASGHAANAVAHVRRWIAKYQQRAGQKKVRGMTREEEQEEDDLQ
jgi:hypothetical protein